MKKVINCKNKDAFQRIAKFRFFELPEKMKICEFVGFSIFRASRKIEKSGLLLKLRFFGLVEKSKNQDYY